VTPNAPLLCFAHQSGENVVFVSETRLPFGQQPLLLHGGELIVQTSSATVQTLLLDSHSFLTAANQQTDQYQVSTVTVTAE